MNKGKSIELKKALAMGNYNSNKILNIYYYYTTIEKKNKTYKHINDVMDVESIEYVCICKSHSFSKKTKTKTKWKWLE